MTFDAWNPEDPPVRRDSAPASGTDRDAAAADTGPMLLSASDPDVTAPMPRPGAPSPLNQPDLASLPAPTPPTRTPTPTQTPTPTPPALTPPALTLPAPAPAPAPASPAPDLPSPVPPSRQANGWSSFGATPSRPPAAGPPNTGPAQFLPPVAPPTEAVPSPAPAANPVPRWGWRALVSFVAGGLLAAAGFGAAQIGQTTTAETAATQVAVDTTIPVATVPPVRDPIPVPTIPADGAEPAEFVAAALGPSVVQIDTNFGVGSGVIFGDGLILTNNHVVADAVRIVVRLSDGREFPAELTGADVNTDVAVVSVGPGLGLPVAQLALGEKARVGQVAIAIGSPFDLQQSVTAGIVSAVDRPIPNSETSVVAMIQTDAPINPGNSGGALADRLGRVIGINTSIQTDGLTAANVGVGFAIPIDTAVRIADLLVAGSPIQPGFLGVRGQQTDQAGVMLTEVTEGSAAEDAGLLVGDRVLTFNGAPITEFVELAGLVLANQAGDVVDLQVVRDGELIEIQVTLGLRGN